MNLQAQLEEIVSSGFDGCAVRSEDVLSVSTKSSRCSDANPSVLSPKSRTLSRTSSMSSATSSGSLGQDDEDIFWLDHARISVMEAMFSILGHLKYHLVNIDDSIKKNLTFDPEGFVSDLPTEFHSYTRQLVYSRMLGDLVARVINKQAPVFEKLCGFWRSLGVNDEKRKMSPIKRKLHDLVTGLGYSHGATRSAISQLIELDPDDLNSLLSSLAKVRETLDCMNIPRYLVSTDAIVASVDNSRTRKLRGYLQRVDEKSQPPLVCVISLNRHHPNLNSSWETQCDFIGRIPFLNEALVTEVTVATLPVLESTPLDPASAKLTSLNLTNILESSEDARIQNLISLLGAENSESIPLTSIEQGTFQWSESQMHAIADDTTDALLAHIAAVHVANKNVVLLSKRKILELESVIEEKDRRIKQLEQRMTVIP